MAVITPALGRRLPRELISAAPRRFTALPKHPGCRPAQHSRRLHTFQPLYRVTAESPLPIPSKEARTRQRYSSRRTGSAAASLIASVGLFSLFAGLFSLFEPDTAPRDNPSNTSPDDRDPELPRFRLSDVRKHDAKSDRPWITYEDKVYDITDWIPAHPGGDVILRAAGGSIDAYWDIFSIHKSPHVYEILAHYLIGYVDVADLVDGRPLPEQIEDPFNDDPPRDPRLITMTEKPRNAETPLEELTESFITPKELFYVRNHMWVPKVDDPDRYTLTVELLDGSTKEYTLDDLKTKFKPVKITAALQCSGNRRKDMTTHAQKKTNGLQWNLGAISNAVWEGVRLADVLADAGFPLEQARAGDTEARHVQFAGGESYAASIPIGPALDHRGDVLLVYAMNGAPLPPDHGFPLRALVPGHVAARSVKWLKRVVVSDEESQSQWQQKDYKLFGPNVTDPDWSQAPAIQEMPITSAITTVKLGDWAPLLPSASETKERETATKTSEPRGRRASIGGFAYSGGGRAIIRVDVSLDNGTTWDQAELLDDCAVPGPGQESPCNGHKSWAWRRWRYEGVIPLHKKEERREDGKRCSTLFVKATDEAYNAQPEGYDAIWNVRGNLANAWHRVRVCSECENNK
ncbi:molybdopterin binding oxidoreductase [Sodiomyces alkalinus F11]|uniref:Nitrate reductase [NADPH] n=1 Tax=Sodiomyces alkalinus (strain CBS 110278 / VKM F-3762 / F11) TaxID=1314773 RepID=A0A3N2PPY2_SODAK|nr:molybdopterin binding oxidoreductase [Sodiomyces alkalinus F11]ROT36561.1 molybdopterin binding oxidoreductase [Sodiomyces alkalinus F11]